jgi:hypothetical protein
MSPSAALLNSLKDVKGTTHQFSTPSQRCPCLLLTFLMLVVPLSGSIRNHSLKSVALPFVSSLAAHFFAACTQCVDLRCMSPLQQNWS